MKTFPLQTQKKMRILSEYNSNTNIVFFTHLNFEMEYSHYEARTKPGRLKKLEKQTDQ